MPHPVACTGWWRMNSSTNSSLSAEKALTVSSMLSTFRDGRPPREARRPSGVGPSLASDLHDVGRLPALHAIDDIKLDPIASCQTSEALPLDRREVDEDVLPAVLV